MARRYVYKKSEMERLRGKHWAEHYELRNRAVEISKTISANRVLSVIRQFVPPPDMNADANYVRGLDTITGQHRACDEIGLDYIDGSLMCIWYWSDSAWMEFVRQYQSLPDIVEDYYLLYDAVRDAGLLVPISSKPKQRPVDNSGTSRVQVGQMYPNGRKKSAFAAVAK